MNLTAKIQIHAERVAGLRAELDAVIEGLESQTEEAREQLLKYQDMKIETESILDEAGKNYKDAERLLFGAGRLAGRLRELQREQRSAELMALAEDETEPEQVDLAFKKLAELKKTIVKMKGEIHELRLFHGWCSTAGAALAGLNNCPQET